MVKSSEKLSAGPTSVRMEFKYDGGGVGKGGVATLFINDRKVGEGRDSPWQVLAGRDLRHRHGCGLARQRDLHVPITDQTLL